MHRLSIVDDTHFHDALASFDLSLQCFARLFGDPILEDSLSNFDQGWNPTLDPIFDPDEMGAEGRLDRADPLGRRLILDRCCKGGPEASHDSIRGRPEEMMARKEWVGERSGIRRFDGSLGELDEKRRGVGLSRGASFVPREIDVCQVEERRFSPTIGGLFKVGLEQRFIGRSGSDTGANHGLYAIDEPALDDRIALVHPERKGSFEEFGIRRVGLALKKSHVENEALSYDRIGLVKAECPGLLEPERVLDDLVLDRKHLGRARSAADLFLKRRDSLIDFALQNLDHEGFRAREVHALQYDEQGTDQQEMKQR